MRRASRRNGIEPRDRLDSSPAALRQREVGYGGCALKDAGVAEHDHALAPVGGERTHDQLRPDAGRIPERDANAHAWTRYHTFAIFRRSMETTSDTVAHRPLFGVERKYWVTISLAQDTYRVSCANVTTAGLPDIDSYESTSQIAERDRSQEIAAH